jgi:hypothetical protein
MKKLLKRLGILIAVGVVLYGGYMLFVTPNGYTTEEDVVRAFFTNMNEETVCEDTWYEDTTEVCAFLVEEFGDKEIVIDEVVDSVDGMLIRFSADGTDLEFYATFYTYEPTGLRSITADTYYKIEIMN